MVKSPTNACTFLYKTHFHLVFIEMIWYCAETIEYAETCFYFLRLFAKAVASSMRVLSARFMRFAYYLLYSVWMRQARGPIAWGSFWLFACKPHCLQTCMTVSCGYGPRKCFEFLTVVYKAIILCTHITSHHYHRHGNTTCLATTKNSLRE